MADSRVMAQLRKLTQLLDRLYLARNGSDLRFDQGSNLNEAATHLARTLDEIQDLTGASEYVQHNGHIESISHILDKLVGSLEQHVAAYEELQSYLNQYQPMRYITNARYYCEQTKIEWKLWRTIEKSNTELESYCNLLVEVERIVIPVNHPEQSTTTQSCNSNYNGGSRLARDDPSDQVNWHTSIPFRDELFINQLRARHEPLYELPTPLSAEETPMRVPDHIRATQVQNLPSRADGTQCSRDAQWDTLQAGLLTYPLHQHQTLASSPPPYSFSGDPSASMTIPASGSRTGGDTRSRRSDDFIELSKSDREWIDPITAACRAIVRNNFLRPATNTNVYQEYEEQVRESPNYRWFFNFHYRGLALQVDVPIQVFLVGLSVSTPKSSIDCKVLAYVSSDCIVFATSQCKGPLMDPNEPFTRKYGEDQMPKHLRDGLVILDGWTIRFVDVAAFQKGYHLELGITLDLDKRGRNSDLDSGDARASKRYVLYKLRFARPCQRHRFFMELSPWLSPRVTSRSLYSDGGPRRGTDRRCSCEPIDRSPVQPSNQRYHSHQTRSQSRSRSYDQTHREAFELPVHTNSPVYRPYHIGRSSADVLSPRSASPSNHGRSLGPVDLPFQGRSNRSVELAAPYSLSHSTSRSRSIQIH